MLRYSNLGEAGWAAFRRVSAAASAALAMVALVLLGCETTAGSASERSASDSNLAVVSCEGDDPSGSNADGVYGAVSPAAKDLQRASLIDGSLYQTVRTPVSQLYRGMESISRLSAPSEKRCAKSASTRASTLSSGVSRTGPSPASGPCWSARPRRSTDPGLMGAGGLIGALNDGLP